MAADQQERESVQGVQGQSDIPTREPYRADNPETLHTLHTLHRHEESSVDDDVTDATQPTTKSTTHPPHPPKDAASAVTDEQRGEGSTEPPPATPYFSSEVPGAPMADLCNQQRTIAAREYTQVTGVFFPPPGRPGIDAPVDLSPR